MAARSKSDLSLWLIIVGLAAWAVPGAGHFLIRQRVRGIIICCTITLTFLLGLFIGSIGVVDPVGGRVWYMAQMLVSPAVGILGQMTQHGQYSCLARPADVAQIYTGVAGLLNLLCILSAVYMAYCGRGEMIGEEEENA